MWTGGLPTGDNPATQISQYLSCPRRYKHRYLDGWKEKDIRAAMLFGRAFEQAVAAYFQRQDAAAALYREWSAHRDARLHYSEISLAGSFHYTPDDARAAMQALASGELDPSPLISGRGGLSELPRLLDAQRRGEGIRYAISMIGDR